ncbi:uncharacterized protein LOC144172543 isoform X2 [Haemaphysalis longicornis]
MARAVHERCVLRFLVLEDSIDCDLQKDVTASHCSHYDPQHGWITVTCVACVGRVASCGICPSGQSICNRVFEPADAGCHVSGSAKQDGRTKPMSKLSFGSSSVGCDSSLSRALWLVEQWWGPYALGRRTRGSGPVLAAWCFGALGSYLVACCPVQQLGWHQVPEWGHSFLYYVGRECHYSPSDTAAPPAFSYPPTVPLDSGLRAGPFSQPSIPLMQAATSALASKRDGRTRPVPKLSFGSSSGGCSSSLSRALWLVEQWWGPHALGRRTMGSSPVLAAWCFGALGSYMVACCPVQQLGWHQAPEWGHSFLYYAGRECHCSRTETAAPPASSRPILLPASSLRDGPFSQVSPGTAAAPGGLTS